MKNVILSIWIEGHNWKPLKLLQNSQEKKIRNSKNEDNIGEYNIW
jgi:hypothetical protein